ncbi:AAA family ATPase, partial [Rickettsiaceae bacterium]|nr:AAA family ATPase [Rickettsiaceae bacterium]
MATYHANAKVISRSGARCAMSYAAYICGEKATDDRTGMSFDYRKKGDVAYKNIMLPEGMKHLNSTEKLWNAVEKCEDKIAETRYGNYKDPEKQARSLIAKERFLNEASTASTWEVSLPKELSLGENIELADRLAWELFGSKNLIVQYALHDKEGNPHVHFSSNFRQVEGGEFSKSKYRFSRGMVKEMRHSIADTTNDYAQEKGYDFRVDHRSYLSRGIDIEPTKHRGWHASELGDNSRIVLENREILSANTSSLLKDPEELIKVLIDDKTVFNIDELKKSAKERFGGDAQTWHVLEELITKDNAEILIDRASKFGGFLEVAKEVREIALQDKESLTNDDKQELKELKAERLKLADEIFKDSGGYKWLMSKVGMKEEFLEAMTSSSVISWNDRSDFLGSDLPKNLRAGDTLTSLAKAFGAKELDKGLASVFNLENLGESFKGKDSYIANSDLVFEEKIIEAKSKLAEKEFGSILSVILFSDRLMGYKGRTRSDRVGSIISKQEEEQGYNFSKEQKEAAISLVADKAYGSLIGKAGTGKTTTLRSVAEFYKKEGYRVIGTSFQGAAVGELNDSIGKNMDAGFTLSKLSKEWRSIEKGKSSRDRAAKYELTDKTVVILDEAGMASRGLLKPLFERASEKGSKVIIVGDPGQISAIDRADVSRLLFDGGSKLTEVMRQKNKDDIQASDHFASGRIKEGIESYNAKGQLVTGETDFSTKLMMVHDVSAKISVDGSFKHMMIAYKNSDVEDLNIAMQRVQTSKNNIGEDKSITVLTGFASSSSDGSLGRVVSSGEMQKELSEIRGNIIPIKDDKISYNEAHTLLERLEVGSDAHNLLHDTLKPKTFYIGDRVRFTSNFNKGVSGEKVYNGSLGVISSYDRDSNSLTIEREGDKKTEIELESYSSLQLGYAITINGSQGKNVERDNHFFASNTRGAKIGSSESYVAFTRHKRNLIIYTSKEYLNGTDMVGGIKTNNPEETQLHQKIEERWKMTAHDFKGNPDLELVYSMQKTSDEKRKLWSFMQKDIRAGKHDLIKHPSFGKYKQIKSNLKEMAGEARGNWDNVRIYASHAKITLDDVKRWSGDEEIQVKENEDLVKYREYQKAAKDSWVDILKTKKTHLSKHEKYPEFRRASQSRNELAYRLASFGSEREVYDKSGNKTVTHIYNHLKKNEWKNIKKHSALYIKDQSTKEQSTKERGNDNISLSHRQSTHSTKNTPPMTKNITTSSNNYYNTKADSGHNLKKHELYQAQKELWDSEHLELKDRVRFKAEQITRDLLGEPNKKLSSKNELRYGDRGKLTVKIAGEKAGTWYDFARGEGGDMFRLAGEARYGDFKNSAEYLRSMVGMMPGQKINLRVDNVSKEQIEEKTKQELLEQEKQAVAKSAYVQKLYERSKDIGERTIAHRYLSKTRSIDASLSPDIRTTGIYDRENKEYLPALVAFSRDKDGNITGGQHISLNKETNGKADISVPKKSFGTISGSFVDLGTIGAGKDDNIINSNNNDNKNNPENTKQADITIIAEGLETGLSVKQAMRMHSEKHKTTTNTKMKTLCSLGISNIKNYEPIQGQKIIIAADNDGKNSITDKTIESAKSALEEKGAFVEIVRPEKEGDFNDVLKQDGASAVAKAFEPSILKQIERVEVGQEEQRDNPAKDRGGSSRSEMKRKFRESENIFKVRMEEARRENEAKAPKNNKVMEAEAPITQRDIDKAMQYKSDNGLS